MTANRVVVSVMAAMCVALVGCEGAAKKAWTDVLAQCTHTDDIPSKNLLYFGPSNTIGPGSAWRPKDEGGYGLRFTLDSAAPSDEVREGMVRKGGNATCQGGQQIKVSVSPSILLSAPGSPVTGDLAADLDKADEVLVKVDTWRVDRIQELRYEQWLASPESGDYGEDILGESWQNRRVMDAAIAVEGFSAFLTFSRSIAGSLKAKIPASGIDLGAGLRASWSDDQTLVVTAQSPFYIAGSLVALNESGVYGVLTAANGGGDLLSDQPVLVDNAAVGLELVEPRP